MGHSPHQQVSHYSILQKYYRKSQIIQEKQIWTTGINILWGVCTQKIYLQHNPYIPRLGEHDRRVGGNSVTKRTKKSACAAVSPRNDKETTFLIFYQYVCLNKTWKIKKWIDLLTLKDKFHCMFFETKNCRQIMTIEKENQLLSLKSQQLIIQKKLVSLEVTNTQATL